MLRQAGPRTCVKRWPIPAAKRLKDSFMILQKSRIIPFNWSSYGKTFTGNRILRLEVAHFFFFWKSSNKSLKKKLLFTHSYKANGSTPGLFLPILAGGFSCAGQATLELCAWMGKYCQNCMAGMGNGCTAAKSSSDSWNRCVQYN